MIRLDPPDPLGRQVAALRAYLVAHGIPVLREDIAKANRNRTLGRRNAVIERDAKAMSAQIRDVLRQLTEREIQRQMGRVRKSDEDLERRLLQILQLFGLQRVDAAGRTAGGNDWLIERIDVSSFMRTKEIRVQDILRETRERISEAVRRVLIESERSDRQLSTGATARRIREELQDMPAQRAALIARTELVQAENTGLVEGYTAAGVDELEWVAYSDGRSGDRRHDRMDGKRVRIGEYFVTPLGNRLRYPGDPLAPIKETANCRCTVVAHKPSKR